MPAAQELRVHIANKPGVLGQVSAILSEAGINIEGFAVWGGVARLFVSDTQRAQDLLDEEGFPCAVADVLRLHLPDEPGNLAEVAEVLGSAGINIDYAYTVTPDQPGEAAFVLAVDPKRAQGILD
jgi:hypothetical protein